MKKKVPSTKVVIKGNKGAWHFCFPFRKGVRDGEEKLYSKRLA